MKYTSDGWAVMENASEDVPAAMHNARRWALLPRQDTPEAKLARVLAHCRQHPDEPCKSVVGIIEGER